MSYFCLEILDYQTHIYRLLPPLAEVIALHFTGRYSSTIYLFHTGNRGLYKKYRALIEHLKVGDAKELSDVHASSAGLKAFASWTTRDIIIICRDCCGGHGYSAYNGFARLIQDFQVQTTWDG